MLIRKSVIERARGTDVVAFFEKRYGYTFTQRGSTYRCRQHPSLAIKSNRLSWYWHSKGIGGHGALDYLIKVENMPFSNAVSALMGITDIAARPEQAAELPKPFALPEKANTSLRLYGYLCGKRGIDSGIVDTLIQRGDLYEDRRGNVVFVGYDEHGTARFASLRGTGDSVFRMDCAGSDKRHGFKMVLTPADTLYVYESPIDAMSHATIENIVSNDKDAWKKHCRLSLAGTSDAALSFFLKEHKPIGGLVFCLDNDKAGREAAALMSRKYADMGYLTTAILPEGKDFNEDLTEIIQKGLPIKAREDISDRGSDRT